MKINRVGQEPFEFKRGDRVCYNGKNVTVLGISEARQVVRIASDKAVRKGGFEVPYGYIYPALIEITKPIKGLSALSKTINKVNSKNEPSGGWGAMDKVIN